MGEIEQILWMKLNSISEVKFSENKISRLCNLLLKITEKYAANLINRYYTIESSENADFSPDINCKKQNINIFIPYFSQPTQITPQFNPMMNPSINPIFLPQFLQ